MLIKRTHLTLEILLGIFVAYLLITRLFIIGLQSYPQQSLSYLEKITGWHFEMSSIELEQTWLGAKFDIQGLQLLNNAVDLQAEKVTGDFNLFAPMLPVLSFGESIQVKQLSIRNLSPKSQSLTQDLPGISELSVAYTNAVDFLRSQTFTKRMWQKVSIDSLILNGFLNSEDSAIQIDNLDLVKASQINLVAEFGVRYKDALNFERFSTKLNFTPNSWGGLSHGSVNLISYHPLKAQHLARLLPEKWAEVLPSGEVLIDWQTDFQDSKISHSVVHLNAQMLQWQEDNEVLPHSVGLELKWNPLLDENLGKNLASFHLSKVQLDNRYVETLSPIKLTVANEQELVLSAEKFDIQPFKQMLRAFIETRYISELLNEAVELKVSDFAVRLNWKSLEVPMFKMRLARLGIPLTAFPGVAAQDVTLIKFEKQVVLETAEPVWVLEPRIHPLPLKVSLPASVHSNYEEGKYELEAFDFRVNDLALNLKQLEYQPGELRLQAGLRSETADEILPYLPYELMGKSLNKWLKEAGIRGGKSRVEVNYKLSFNPEVVNLQRTQEEFLRGLSLNGSIEKAGFRFNAKWPEITNTDLTFNFQNSLLSFDSEALRFKGVSKPIKAKAVISDLTQKNIALDISGRVTAPLSEMAGFIKRTPLPGKIGLERYLQQPEQLNGESTLVLDKIWVPLFGHGTKEERVNGSLRFKDAQLNIAELPEAKSVTGQLYFSENSLKANNIKLTVFDSPVSLDIVTHQKKEQIEFNFAGQANYKSAPYFAKPVPFNLNFYLAKKQQDQPVKFDGHFFINQAESRIPEPFSAKNITQPLELEGRIKDDRVFINVITRDIAQADLVWNLNDKKLEKFQGYIGSMVNAQREWGGKDSYIRGKLKQLDVSQWWKWWSQLPASEENGLGAIKWQNSELEIPLLIYKEQNLHNAHINLQTVDGNALKASLQSDEVVGSALLPDQGVIEVAVDKLHLKSKAQNTFAQGSSDICPLETTQVDYPEVKFNARNVRFDQYAFDKLSFLIQPLDEGYEAQNFKALLSRGAGEISGKYRFDQLKNLSAANLNLQSSNIEELLKLFEINQGVEAKKTQINAEVSWFGGIDCFSINDLFGNLGFRLEDGVVKDVEPGFARLLGLLSVDSLARRLRLKLDDVTNKGLVYDNIKGQGLLNEDKLVLKAFDLNAPAAKVNMKGDILLDKQSFDLNAQVTPSVGSSLPTIAALAGMANPLTALAVYTLMKVLPDVNENLVTYEYSIIGPWKEPEIKLKEEKK